VTLSLDSRVYLVHDVTPYINKDSTIAQKKLRFYFQIICNLFRVVYAFDILRIFMAFSVELIWLPRYMNLSTAFISLPDP